MQIEQIINSIYEIVWSLPIILMFVIVSLYFTCKLNFIQIKNLKEAFCCILKPNDKKTLGDISNFGALCTALSATLGTGNIVGVAVALYVGGPGSLFWLIISSFFSLATKYCEGFLAIKYRVVDADKKIIGGPMYYIEKGLKNKFLAKIFAFFGMCVALVGVGTLAQTNSIVSAVSSFGIPNYLAIAILGLIVSFVIFGGIYRISEIAKKIVPLMTIFYLGAALIILIINYDKIFPALKLIFIDAFSLKSVVGGSLLSSIQTGISRGIFCHEAGLGSAAIASAAAKTNSPKEQGLVCMIGAFLSIIVCVITGLVLIITSNDTHIFSDCLISTTQLTAHSFDIGLKINNLGKYIVNTSILFFAFTSIIGWNYYGEKCVQYLFSTKIIFFYRLLFLFFVIIGPFLKIEFVFTIADIVTGLMAIPNILSLVRLRKEIY